MRYLVLSSSWGCSQGLGLQAVKGQGNTHTVGWVASLGEGGAGHSWGKGRADRSWGGGRALSLEGRQQLSYKVVFLQNRRSSMEK